MKSINNKKDTPWLDITHNGNKAIYAGFINNFEYLIDNISDMDKVKAILLKEHLSFGVIITLPNLQVAICDKTQSYPVYYNLKTQKISYDVSEIITCENIDKNALLEFSMAGYTLGNKTLYNDIKQLQAGEILICTNKEIKTIRYYRYSPKPTKSPKADKEYIEELDNIINNSVNRSIDQAETRPICVPLSGGLDSRLITAKLHELGAKKLTTFSYGLKNNFEAKMAKKVAKQIGVKWFMVEAKPKNAQKLYNSDLRKDYTNYAHGLSRIPSYVEFEALHNIKSNNLIPETSIIINGQTGDYISGGHIPACLYENDLPNKDDMYYYIIDKHLSLWGNLKTPENIDILKQNISEILPPYDENKSLKDNLISQYESFEWQERQCKMVVNGQKAYEFFGYSWSLPLWDKELMDFFEKLPWELKYKQNLFKQYLKQYNYKGVFDYSSAEPKIWKPQQYWIVITARIIGILKSARAKEEFYKKMSYYGDMHWQYALFGKALYDKHHKNLRNMVSLAVLDFLNEQAIDFPAKTD